MQPININEATATNRVLDFLALDSSGNPLSAADMTGGTWSVYLSKNGAAGVAATNTPSEVDATHMKGYFRLQFTQTEVNTSPTLVAYITNTGGTKTMESLAIRISINPANGQPGAGARPNSVLDNYVYATYSGIKRATSWRERVFATQALADAATLGHTDGTDGEIERFTGTATYNTDGTLASLKVDKVL